jgi:hypothetical protein
LEEAAALARYLRGFAHAREISSIEEIPVPRRLPRPQPDTGSPLPLEESWLPQDP